MGVTNWDEIRTAFQVARVGTVSGAADVLGVHHATVIRHIDALEERLGTKLFQRHARGYTPTEAGADLLSVAQTTEDQFAQLAGRIRGRGEDVSGELIITTLLELGPLLVPGMAKFQAIHEGLIVRLLTGARVFRLEYGEAHVAVRGGPAPEEPDNVVQPLGELACALYGSKDYLEQYGTPKTDADLGSHRFISSDDPKSRAPFNRWVQDNIPTDQISFRVSDLALSNDAVAAGAGLGVLALSSAHNHPDLVQIMPPRDEWAAPLWLVTHVDLHRTSKVQAFTKFLKEEAKTWPC